MEHDHYQRPLAPHSQPGSRAHATQLASGMVFGEYVLDRFIGSGACGEVWLGRHHAWREKVAAIKVATNHEFAQSLRDEGVIQYDLSELASENLVRVYGLNLMSDPPYLVLEFVDGEDLRGRLKRSQRLSISESIHLLTGVLRGLELAHRHNIVHRDIKPENVLISREGIAKLADFSVARRIPDTNTLRISLDTDTPATASLAGTLMYMAPEQRRGEAPDTRSDMYSIGLLLFEMLTGELPEPGDRLQEFRADVPDQLDDLFQRCFTRADKRLNNAGEALRFLSAPQTARTRKPERAPASALLRPEQPVVKDKAPREPSEKKGKRESRVLSTRDLNFINPALAAAAEADAALPGDGGKGILSTRSMDALSPRAASPLKSYQSDPKAPGVKGRSPDRVDLGGQNSGAAASASTDQYQRAAEAESSPRPADVTDVLSAIRSMPEDEARGSASHPAQQPVSSAPPPLRTLYRNDEAALAASLYARGRFSDAADEFQRLADASPDSFAAFKGLAMSLFKAGKPKRALNAYRRALELRPEAAEIWNNIGVVFLSLRKYRDAERALLRAIQLRPRYAPALANYSAVLRGLGRDDEARRAAELALDIDPDNFEAAYNAGL